MAQESPTISYTNPRVCSSKANALFHIIYGTVPNPHAGQPRFATKQEIICCPATPCLGHWHFCSGCQYTSERTLQHANLLVQITKGAQSLSTLLNLSPTNAIHTSKLCGTVDSQKKEPLCTWVHIEVIFANTPNLGKNQELP